MKKDSILHAGFSPLPGAKERIWQRVQQGSKPPLHSSYTVRWITGAVCALGLFMAIGLCTRPTPHPTQLAKLNMQLPLESKTTPRGFELLDNYIPYQ